MYHIPLRATETSQVCCKGIKARPDVFWDSNSNVLSLNLKLCRTKVDIKRVIRGYVLRNYVV